MYPVQFYPICRQYPGVPYEWLSNIYSVLQELVRFFQAYTAKNFVQVRGVKNGISLSKHFATQGRIQLRVYFDLYFNQNSIRILQTLTRTSLAPVSYQSSSRSRKGQKFTNIPCNKFLGLDQSRTSTNQCQIGSQIWQKSRPRHLAQFKTSGELVSNQCSSRGGSNLAMVQSNSSKGLSKLQTQIRSG